MNDELSEDYGDLNERRNRRNRRNRLVAWITIIALLVVGGGATGLALLFG